MLFEDLRRQYELWLTTTQDVSHHTVLAYGSDVSALQAFLEPDFDVTKLSKEDLYGFTSYLTANGRSSSTIKRRLCGIRSFCEWLTHTEHLPSNPASGLAIRFSRPRRLPRCLPPSDLQRLIRHLSTEAELTSGVLGPATGESKSTQATSLLSVLLMVGTGMRVGELTQTRLSQVDLPSRTIRVVGKGLRERMVYLSNDAIVQLLAHYISQSTPVHDPQQMLLINRSGNPLTPSALRARLERAGAKAGLANRLTPHMLRHTAATQLIEAGVDIRFVQRLLGHASLTTTEIYTHVADRSLRHAVTEADVLGEFLTLR